MPTTIADAPFHPSLAVRDLPRSRGWYADKLGWEPTVEAPGTLVYELAPNAAFTLFETEHAGSARNTVMNWNVEDVRVEVARLRGRGVDFENYDFGDVKTIDGIMGDEAHGMNAWFKDPDGNIVGVLSPAPGSDDGGAAISGMIAAADLDRAKAWYRDKLGLEPMSEMPGVIASYRTGGTVFSVYKTEFAGTARNTVGVWRLAGIRDEVARLRGRGVTFEEVEFDGGARTVGGILVGDDGRDENAWFTDSEGNVLALAESG